jgi:hypothetical protein
MRDRRQTRELSRPIDPVYWERVPLQLRCAVVFKLCRPWIAKGEELAILFVEPHSKGLMGFSATLDACTERITLHSAFPS